MRDEVPSSASQVEEDGAISPIEAEKVLAMLCVNYGFCLHGADR